MAIRPFSFAKATAGLLARAGAAAARFLLFLTCIKAAAALFHDTATMRRRFVLPIIVAIGPLLFASCTRSRATQQDPASATRTFTVTGVVRAPLHEGQVVIEHEAVPGFMPGMTMPFYVASETDAARLETGDRVRFKFVVGETSHAQDFEIIGHETPSNSPGSRSGPRVHRLKVGEIVPDFQLEDQDGRPCTAVDLDGRLTVVTFIFTRCPVPEYCPATTLKFRSLQTAIDANPSLRDRASLISITLDPEYDSPAILRAYGEAVGAEFARWRFLTGDAAAAHEFVRAFSVFAERRNGTLDHTLCTALIGPDRRIIDIWRGNGWKVGEITAALESVAKG